MGCLNDRDWGHWFANVHLSGPCNRACYFCIGQHMMALDPLNTLDVWPLPGWDKFVAECQARDVREVYVTGSNTDPLMCGQLPKLAEAVREELGPDVFGVRTNGVTRQHRLGLFDQVSLSVTSFDPELYRLTMGRGVPPNLGQIISASNRVWANVVLCPETVHSGDIIKTLAVLCNAGILKANLREPYGQPHVGDPLKAWCKQSSELHGNPQYDFHGLEVTYWDVHTTHVSSVNLYANGRVSTEYSVTKGHAESGEVRPQSCFQHGRNHEQWIG